VDVARRLAPDLNHLDGGEAEGVADRVVGERDLDRKPDSDDGGANDLVVLGRKTLEVDVEELSLAERSQ
jgi:hypothetical protein